LVECAWCMPEGGGIELSRAMAARLALLLRKFDVTAPPLRRWWCVRLDRSERLPAPCGRTVPWRLMGGACGGLSECREDSGRLAPRLRGAGMSSAVALGGGLERSARGPRSGVCGEEDSPSGGEADSPCQGEALRLATGVVRVARASNGESTRD
jgi:hypothetical protein